MPRTTRPPSTKPWRTYSARDGRKIERSVRTEAEPRCPACGAVLETQPESRASPCLVLDATSYDLACRGCRRFWCVVEHTQRSLRLIRMRRLAAAVGAVEPSDGMSISQGASVARAHG